MSKIAVLLPREFMLEQAKNIIEEEQMDIEFLKKIKTEDSVYEARKVVEDGAGIIVARGGQAAYIKRYTNIPIAEVVLTGQEMGRLIKRAKLQLDKELPHIAVIGFKNMFGDMSYFEEIFDIKLTTHFVNAMEELVDKVELAKCEGAELLIGGDVVNELASGMGIPSIFIESTEDSIRNALNTACKMSYAAELEKTNVAQFETVLETSANGIIRINEETEVLIVNKMAQELLGKSESDIIGKKIENVIADLEVKYIHGVLQGTRDTYTTSVKMANQTVMITLTPIEYENQISGAILTFYRVTTQKNRESDKYREMYLHGYIAKHHFSDIRVSGVKMQKAVENAKMYALSTKPVLIYGEEGTEKEIFAQCIHNNSAYRSGPFVSINLSSMTEQMQMERLFGNPYSEDESVRKGALTIGNLGSVLIAEVERLAPAAQYRLYRAIRYDALLQNDLEKSQTLDNRVLVTARKNLADCVKDGTFREDLYYLLNGLVVEIPPLRERPDDIESSVRQAKSQFSKRYSKYLQISDEAIECMRSYSWEGNELQLEAFCERMFLTTTKKMIHGDYVRKLLKELYPEPGTLEGEREVVVYKHPDAVRIAELLYKHRGNRVAVAK
ncbi:PrpR N-terminal domain-containing protein, partial [Lachnospiraceae bacterium OttesenSCG-928-E19]|nr:PrpR N-terminal domain-containing protein [Lachnospiraceae bacterium OttesenSCG-928-E19]